MNNSVATEVGTLYVALRDEICHFLRSRFGEGPPDPEDMVQAAFARYAALEDRSSIENPRAFLYAAARNLTIDELRRSARSARYANEPGIDAEFDALDRTTPEHVLLVRERCAAVQTVIAAMSAEQREMLMLHRLHGLSMAEIATQMGSSKTSVHRQIADAMLRLHRGSTRET